MPDAVETQAAPSTATEAAPSTPQTFEIPRSGTPEYAEWRVSGEIPAKKEQPKKEASASSDTGKDQTPEDEANSGAKEAQEKGKRRPDAEARIKQLNDENKRIKAELEDARKGKTEKAESSAAAKQPQTYKDWRAEFKPSKWIETYLTDNADATYEDANAAMADHLGDVRDQFRSFEQRDAEASKQIVTKVEDAKARYGEDALDTIIPTGEKITKDPRIAGVIKEMVKDSDVMVDLLYVLGTDPKLDEFLELSRTNPRKAVRYVVEVEQGIEAAFKGSKTATEGAERGADGKFVAKPAETETPAKRGRESAAEPPIELGSRGASTLSESERALKEMANNPNAFGKWKAAEDAAELRRRRGM